MSKDGTSAKCMACGTPVGRGKEGGEQQGRSAAPAAAGSAPTFSFGAPKADDKPAPTCTGGFTFGAPKADDKAALVPATAGGFTFGAPKADDKAAALVPATAGGFTTFGATKVDGKPVPATVGGFTFGATKVDDKPAPATGGFTFGAPKVDDPKPKKTVDEETIMNSTSNTSLQNTLPTFVYPNPKKTVNGETREEWDVQRDHHKGLADAAFRSCDYKLAIQEYSNAITFDPEYHILYSNRSAAYLANGETSKSLADAKQCVSLKPEFVKGYNRLASSLMSLGRWNEARNVYKHILSSLDKDNDVAKKGLQDCREKESNATEAEIKMIRLAQQEQEKESDGQSKKETDTPASEQTARGDKEEDGEDEVDLLNDYVVEVEEVKTVKISNAEEKVVETQTSTTNSKNKNEDRLALAAAALVEAVSLEVDSVTQNQISINLEALKGSFETELSTLTKSVKASNEKFDDKINTVNQKLSSLCSAVEKTNTLLESQAKLKILQRAEKAKLKRLDLASARTTLGSFNYRKGHNIDTNSSVLVESILDCFILGHGYTLPADSHLNYDCTEANKALFREKIVKQVITLIGRKPRLVDEGNGKFAIFYE